MLKLYDTSGLSTDLPVGPIANASAELLLKNILLELRVMNEYLAHQATTNGPVDMVRSELLADTI